MSGILGILASQRHTIPYRPELNQITGSVTGSIFLQHTVYLWWEVHGRRPFHMDNKSWMEALGFTRTEFTTARAKVASKVPAGSSKAAILAQNLVIYWTDGQRRTWYQVNEDRLVEALEALYSTHHPTPRTTPRVTPVTSRVGRKAVPGEPVDRPWEVPDELRDKGLVLMGRLVDRPYRLLSQRKKTTGRVPTVDDWHEIIYWANLYLRKIDRGEMPRGKAVGAFWVAVRDAEPVPLTREDIVPQVQEEEPTPQDAQGRPENLPPGVEDVTDEIRPLLASTLPIGTVEVWLDGVQFIQSDGIVLVVAPNDQKRAYLEARLKKKIEESAPGKELLFYAGELTDALTNFQGLH